ncbi:MAG: DUF2946 domain-containing protein [Burkholderiaceae bacterium]
MLARFVLAWFALFVGASIASPLVKPTAVQVVCSVGVKMIVVDDDGSSPKVASGLDCPLCATVAPAALGWALSFALADGRSHALKPAVAAHLASVTRSPLPARGPPLVS